MRYVVLQAITVASSLLAALPVRAAVTEGWVQRYMNPTTQVARGEASRVVVDSSGDAIVTGYIWDDINIPRMLTIKYSGVDGSVIWQRLHESGEGGGTALALDGDGDIIVTAFTSGEFYTAKYAAGTGAILWERSYDGPFGQDFPMAVAVDAGGNVIVAGYSDNGITNDVESRVYYTARYAADDGALLWEQRYHSPGHSGEARSVAVDAGGNVLVTGISTGTNNWDYCTIKYAAADGALLWERRYDGGTNGHDQPSAVAVDSSGDVIVTGFSYNGEDDDFYTAKYASMNGATLWEKRSDRPGRAQALALAANGDAIVTGSSWTSGNGYDYYTAKYAAVDGALLWQKFSGGEITDEPAAIALDAAGNVVVTGYSYHTDTKHDYYTVKYSASDGALRWEKRFSGPMFSDVAMAVAVDTTGDVFVTGTSEGDDDHYYTIKYAAADGASLWEEPGRIPADFPDVCRAMALDGSGNVFVTGRSFSRPGSSDIYTVKYARTTGAILWERRTDGNAGGGNEPTGLAVDAQGNVVITGYAARENNYRNFHTVKYAGGNGAILWEQYYHGLGANDDNAPTAIVIDSHDDVIVTGFSGALPNWDFYTAKYAGANGTLMWEKRFDGPASGNDQPAALALDSHGNVIVTGSSGNQNSSNHFDFHTVVYDTDGAVLWDRRYDGPSKGVDHPAAVAVDPAGNAIVTGTSDTEYYTAKYASTNGALLWEKRYADPTNDFSYAYAVAVDSTGNVFVCGNSFAAGYAQLHTIKYAAGNGAFAWERTTPGLVTVGAPVALLIDSDENVIVAGSVSGPPPANYQDFYVAKLAAHDGRVLWQRYYDGPGEQTELLAPRGLAARDGMVVLAGTSSGNPPEHDDAASTGGEMIPGALARHVVHYEMATVVFWEKAPPVSIARVPAGIRLRFAGSPDTTYHVERAAVLTGPWATLAMVIAPSEGLAEYIDNAPTLGMSYYRIVTP